MAKIESLSFRTFFAECNKCPPRPYQTRLAEQDWRETLIIPTGFGKTAAVIAAWLWKLMRADRNTPRRLVYCLPMRTLVEQTEKVAGEWASKAQELFGFHCAVDVLMGGRERKGRDIPDWMLDPTLPAIIVGTQDMLISAALMRAYGASRFRWPVDFALLQNDALWVFDEAQLAGATLPTSAQLEGLRRKFGVGRNTRTLWLSATLDPSWLNTVDFTTADGTRSHDLDEVDIETAQHLWKAKKRLNALQIGAATGDKRYADSLAKHAQAVARPGTNTIVFLNTVGRAQAVYGAVKKSPYQGECLLVHSRFRKEDRDGRVDKLRQKAPAEGRIIVATQALEAGVDVTSSVLVTELAPWSSLVQRFGRCNRFGECNGAGAEVFWIDLAESEAKPYAGPELELARSNLRSLLSCGPADLVDIPLPVPEPSAVIRKRDLLDLFDTEPDLSGFDVDVSIYVRDAQDTDVRLFWRHVLPDGPAPDEGTPKRDEICPAPIGGAKQLVSREGVSAWRFDALTREWRRVSKNDVYPGLTILVSAESGGYDHERGFDPASVIAVVPHATEPETVRSFDGDEDTQSRVRVSLAKHSVHVREHVLRIAAALDLAPEEKELLAECGLWHDLGKAHEVFKARCGLSPQEAPLAKTPEYEPRRKTEQNRPYFRHELASALAFLAQRQWSEDANLPAYLIAAHHGKVRMRIRALPKERSPGHNRLFARGVWDGDILPETDLGAVVVGENSLELDIMQLGSGPHGDSWQARTQKLLNKLGPFRLAWYEALLRIADWYASGAEEKAGHDDL